MGARDWIKERIGEAAFAQLTDELTPSEAWSVLMEVAARRAGRRSLRALTEQWTRDRFVSPSALDLRATRRLELRLLEAAVGFEAIELSPLAPLGTCSVMAPASQHKIVSTVRGTEVVSDPTNVMALECARRVHATGKPTAIRLVTCHRVVRAQPAPKKPGFAQHFNLFALATATRERADHAGLQEALADHIAVHLRALDAIAADGYRLPPPSVTLLARPGLAHVAERFATRLPRVAMKQAVLDHPYYDGGMRFSIALGGGSDDPIPLVDGGAFGWLAALTGDRRDLFIASGLGPQLIATLWPKTGDGA
jgi:hypothetical protein